MAAPLGVLAIASAGWGIFSRVVGQSSLWATADERGFAGSRRAYRERACDIRLPEVRRQTPSHLARTVCSSRISTKTGFESPGKMIEMEHVMRALVSVVAFSIFVQFQPINSSAQVISETDLLMKMREAESSCSGAATTTQENVIQRLMSEVVGKEIEVIAAVVEGFSDYEVMGVSFRKDQSTNPTTWWATRDYSDSVKRSHFTFGIGSVNVGPSPATTRLVSDSAGLPSPASVDCIPEQYSHSAGYRRRPKCPSWALRGFGGMDRIGQCYFVKLHRGSTEYEIMLRDSSVLDDLRIGDEVSVRFLLTGAKNDTFSGVLKSISKEVVVIKCTNGHEYAPSAGFKFCPKCGLPVTKM